MMGIAFSYLYEKALLRRGCCGWCNQWNDVNRLEPLCPNCYWPGNFIWYMITDLKVPEGY